MNERITEDLVRKHFEQSIIKSGKDIVIEPQKSKNPKIIKLLKNASKSGDGIGLPEFIITFPSPNTDFLIVIECKADTKKHESKNRDNYVSFAVDGVLLYASYLKKEYNVLAIAISGEDTSNLKVSHFLWLREDRQYVEKFGDHLLDVGNYLSEYMGSKEKFNQDYQSLMSYSKELNNKLHSKKVKESQRSFLISGILIALQNKGFRKSYKDKNNAAQLANYLFQTLIDELSNAEIQIKKIENIKTTFTFILTHNTLTTEKEFLESLIEEIDDRINSFIKTYKYFDTLGQFYIEFLRYANNDKGLGIVLTPFHVTELFVSLAEVSKDSVILDNCCGTGGFLISAMKDMVKEAKKDYVKIQKIKEEQIIGIEFQDDIYSLVVSNMFIHGDGKSNIYPNDCFKMNNIDELVKNILYNHIKIKGVRTIFQLTNHIQNIDSPLKKVER